jgi:pimeloyl-ACP methyl ester carboxylesterase
MIPSALALRRDYKDLTLPAVIIAGQGDKAAFRRSSERLVAEIRGSVLQIVSGAGHMVHHLAPRQVAQAVERMTEASHGQPGVPGRRRYDVSAAA